MKNILVIFGGNSLEKDISIITANQVLNNFDYSKYKAYPLFLDDRFYYVKNAQKIDNFITRSEKEFVNAAIIEQGLFVLKNGKYKKLCDIDAALICCHGGYGENGALQGLLDIENIPYTSPALKPSCVFMYKSITKMALKRYGIQTIKSTVIRRNEELNDIVCGLEYPIIVKPNSMGSSIGISVAHDKRELLQGLETAFALDEEVIVERALENFRELNIAAYQFNGEIILSQIEEVIGMKDFMSFYDKYEDKENNIHREFPANIEKNIVEKIKTIATNVYFKMGCKGVIRFDFLLDNTKLYLNEVNTIPGSLAFYLFKDISLKELTSNMIEESINLHKKTKGNVEYKSNVLSYYSASNSKNGKIRSTKI